MNITHGVGTSQAPSSSETPSLAPNLTCSSPGVRITDCRANTVDEKWSRDCGVFVCLCVSECMGACSVAFGIYVSVCVMCMTSLSEGACGGYTNTEEGYLYFQEIMAVSVRSGSL